jgi:hypothetical protein
MRILRYIGTGVGILASTAALAGTASASVTPANRDQVAVAPDASAARPNIASDCFGGYISATWAWGTCKGESGGWGGFALTVQCYYWHANTVYGNAPHTVYASCPSWSHITKISVYPAAF